jgi:hypothetical protein
MIIRIYLVEANFKIYAPFGGDTALSEGYILGKLVKHKLKAISLLLLAVLTFSQISVAKAASYTYNISSTTFTSTIGSVTSGSVSGSFDYDSVTRMSSNANFSVTLNGSVYAITGIAPSLGSYLVFTNNVAQDEPTVWVRSLELPASDTFGNVTVYGGEASPVGSGGTKCSDLRLRCAVRSFNVFACRAAGNMTARSPAPNSRRDFQIMRPAPTIWRVAGGRTALSARAVAARRDGC